MLYSVIRLLVITACCALAGVFSMHYLQLQRYQIADLRKTLKKHPDRLLLPDALIAAVAALVSWYLPVLMSLVIQKEAVRTPLCSWLSLALFALAAVVLFFSRRAIPMKRPFGVTRRICRLLVMLCILNLTGALLLSLLKLSPYFIFAAADYMVALAARIMQPLENRINAGFYNSARQKLAAHKGLIRIGITGSFGKTDVKLMLKTILSEKYRVLATPPSFSTAMGVSRVVNEQLKSGHQVFIAEMGAQKKGEIKEIAKLVAPQYGVLTCVGDAHLDTFGSLEQAAQTKYELIQALPDDGDAFFGSDAGFGDRLYHMCKRENKFRTGIGPDKGFHVCAGNIQTGVRGTRLELTCADGSHAWMQIPLLGSYNVRNLALCAAVARRLGMSMEEIARGAEKLKPVKHHLQLVPGEVNVIDDSENQLPEAALEALRVLAEFPGRRILVTSGLIEPEKGPANKNYAFGIQICGCADYVILIDPEATREIMDGLMSAKFPKSSVRMVREGSDAAAIIREIAGPGDTVLYEGVYPEE
ncbi:MAG: UDP-N-acetylmuramoyl-tripeptide--D-alanyl-D-alanine ligase [Clostridia bacterium]|nr:UDP-N-acetylmuramoyl-tripeptide--D-alanyl-D-alanine ligase [Clostridia bacterium]